MIAKFGPHGVELTLDKREFDFLALTLSYVLDGISIEDHDFANILGMTREAAEAMRDDLMASEHAARARGEHWNPSVNPAAPEA